MPVKNPILIYEFVFRPALIKYGLWEQIRMDHGTEFCLVIFIQRILSQYRINQQRGSYKQTTSTKNYVAERFWPGVNQRVNYPLKRMLNSIVEFNDIDMDDPIIKYCFSWVLLYASGNAVEHLLNSWNHHRVPGPQGCVPIENMIASRGTTTIPIFLIPTTPEAVILYEASGGRLTRNSSFGIDPLANTEHLYQSREMIFHANAPLPQEIFSAAVHGDSAPLEDALNLFYMITLQLR